MTERRYVEFRADGDTLTGVAVRYGDVAKLPGFDETISPGAFAPIDDVILNLQHSRERPIARTGTPYLSLDDNDQRLEVRVKLPQNAHAEMARQLIQDGVLRGLSVEMNVRQDEWHGTSRTIRKADLHGIGIVDRPAYSASTLNRAVMPLSYGATSPLEAREARAARDFRGAVLWDVIGIQSVQRRTAVRFAPDSLDLAEQVTLLHGADYNTALAASGGSDTLRIAKTARGIEWQAKRLARTQAAKDVNALVRSKLITGWKPGFVTFRSSMGKVNLNGMEFDLETVQRGILCEIRLTSDGTGGIGSVGRYLCA